MEEKNRAIGFGIRFLSGLLCVFTGIVLAVFIGVMALSGMLGRSNLRQVMEKSDELQLEFFGYGNELLYFINEEGDATEEEIYDAMKDFWLDMGCDVLDYALTEEGEPINVKKAMKNIKKNEKQMENIIGKEFTEEYYDELEELLELKNDQLKDSYELAGVDGEIKVLKDLRSMKYANIPLTVVIICAGLILLLLHRRPDMAMVRLGISGIIGAVLSFGLGGLGKILAESADEGEEFIAQFMNSFTKTTLSYAVVCLAISIALIVLAKKIRPKAE